LLNPHTEIEYCILNRRNDIYLTNRR